MGTAVPKLRRFPEGNERSYVNMFYDITMYPWFSMILFFASHLYNWTTLS